MTAILAYLNGAKWSIRNVKVWGWLYICNFVLAALVAVPLMSLLEEKLGHSFAVERLMEGFDYTVFTDFMNAYGVAIIPILSQSKLLILLYFVLSIFLMGGILECAKNSPQKAHFQSFTVGSVKYFWRLFRMTFYFLILHLLVFYLFFQLFLTLIHGGDLKQLDSELVIYSRGAIVLSIYFFFVGIITMIQDYAKIFLVTNNTKIVLSAIKNGVKIVFKNFKLILLLSILNWLTFGLIAFLYLTVRGDDLNSTTSGLWFIFILGQLFIFFRMGLKILTVTSKTIFYKTLFPTNNQTLK